MASETQQNKLYFGGSMSALEAGAETEVRLTRFNSIAETKPGSNKRLLVDQPPASRDSLANDMKTISATNFNLASKQQEPQANGKWPWAGSANFNAKQVTLDLQQFLNQNDSSDGSHEPFQVIWRDLSFVVGLSVYDKIINKVLAPISRTFNSTNAGELDDKTNYCKETVVYKSNPQQQQQRDRLSEAGSEYERQEGRVIFENLNGYFKSSEITAILGPSGAGKTSLLNAICGKQDNYTGSVQLQGGGKHRMRLSIIPQRDYLMENLTVRENLLYASKILNTRSGFDHEGNILRVVKMLNLTSCFHSKTANISGGEYKRVSIAQELLRQPDILILDEPTSGLDSLNCKKLIKSLVQLKENSRMGYIKQIAIVMTIHQPDVEVYQMFDHVYCMARGGRVIYDGHPSDTMRVIRDQARAIAGAYEAEERLMPSSTMIANPANLLIEIASEDICGAETIDELASHQREQFKLWIEANCSSSQPTSGQSSGSNSRENLTKMISQTKQQSSKEQKSFINLTPTNASNECNTSNYSLQSNSTKTACDNSPLAAGSICQHKQQVSGSRFLRDKRLLAKNDHSGKFWLHSGLLARRAFTATIRDPLMSLVSFVFHLTLPFVMYTVYSSRIGTVTGCPLIERELDVLGMAHNSTIDKIYQLEDEVHTTFECSTMFFLTTYCFSMCALSIASLAFPMNMHVLLKEVRNGWYNLSSFVVAKTISSFPFEILFPVASIVLIYLLLGFPSSYFEWRLLGIALVMALVSMISYSQGLLFGAIFMDSLQTSIFLAICSSLPLVVLSGFTARISLMPKFLQFLSWFSIYRYSSDSINIIRFGYGLCPCSEETNEYLKSQPSTFKDIPSNIKPLFNFYLVGNGRDENRPQLEKVHGVSYDFILNNTERNNTLNAIENDEIDVFQKLAESVSRSFAFGQDLHNCSEVRSEILKKAGTPDDEFLPFLFAGLFAILIGIKIILFIVVKYKIHSRI